MTHAKREDSVQLCALHGAAAALLAALEAIINDDDDALAADGAALPGRLRYRAIAAIRKARRTP